MNAQRVVLSVLVLLMFSCGKNSPFSEDYGSGSNGDEEVQAEEELNFQADLLPLTDTVSNLSGSALVEINQDVVTIKITLENMPHSLHIGSRSVSDQTCEQIGNNHPVPEIFNSSGELKKIEKTESTTRKALTSELNLANPQNGDSVDLSAKSFVIKAYVSNLNTPVPEGNLIIPVACGVLSIVQ